MNPWTMVGYFLLAVLCGIVLGIAFLSLLLLSLYAKDRKPRGGPF